MMFKKSLDALFFYLMNYGVNDLDLLRENVL